MQEIYTYQFPISSLEVDGQYQCRPSALMGFVQEAAVSTAFEKGMSRDDVLEKYHSIWMLTRYWMELRRPLRWTETLTVKTCDRPPEGKRVHRDMKLYVGEEYVGQAVTVWALVDVDTRQTIDLTPVKELPETLCALCSDISPERIVFDAEMEQTEVRRLHYSDTDCNGHVNNTKYGDFACDAVELERRPQGAFMQELQINFTGECQAGEQLVILRGRRGDRFLIHGQDGDGKSRFDCVARVCEPQNV